MDGQARSGDRPSLSVDSVLRRSRAGPSPADWPKDAQQARPFFVRPVVCGGRKLGRMRIALAIRLSAAVALLVRIPIAMAQHMNAAGTPCEQPASTAEAEKCFMNAAKQAEENLNRTFSENERFFGSQHRSHDEEALRRARRLWTRFREANCDAARGLYSNGTGASVNYWACMESQTRQRARDLTTGYGWLLEKFGHRP